MARNAHSLILITMSPIRGRGSGGAEVESSVAPPAKRKDCMRRAFERMPTEEHPKKESPPVFWQPDLFLQPVRNLVCKKPGKIAFFAMSGN